MKNIDMKNYRAPTRNQIDYALLAGTLAIIVMMVVAWVDWHKRDQIHQHAAQAIAERDQYIDNLENIIYQFGITPKHQQHPTSL